MGKTVSVFHHIHKTNIARTNNPVSWHLQCIHTITTNILPALRNTPITHTQYTHASMTNAYQLCMLCLPFFLCVFRLRSPARHISHHNNESLTLQFCVNHTQYMSEHRGRRSDATGRRGHVHGGPRVCELWCHFDALVAARRHRPLLVQCLRPVQQNERHESAAGQTAQTTGNK